MRAHGAGSPRALYMAESSSSPGGSYRISVRAAKGVDACAIARRLGGGGHTRAAGCELLGNLDNAKSAILAEVEAELDRPETQEES